jgi:hypothetical protein
LWRSPQEPNGKAHTFVLIDSPSHHTLRREMNVLRTLAFAALATMYVAPTQGAQAGKAATTPYYMCFAYTEDGMFFAGGDFELSRAKKMTTANCGMPKTIKVVLVKTIMSHDSKSTVLYDK